MTSPLDALEALEREATPVPWRWFFNPSGSEFVADSHDLTAPAGHLPVLASDGGYWPEPGDANARILATSRNILPEVIALAKAADVALSFTDGGYCSSCGEQWAVTMEMGACRLHPLRAALDALLRAISVEVEK